MHLRVINILSDSYNKISRKIIAITIPTAPKKDTLLRKSSHFLTCTFVSPFLLDDTNANVPSLQ